MNKTEIEKILIHINPKIKGSKKINLVDNGILDSFDIMRFLSIIQKKNKKKLNFSKISRETFSSIDKIKKFIDKNE